MRGGRISETKEEAIRAVLSQERCRGAVLAIPETQESEVHVSRCVRALSLYLMHTRGVIVGRFQGQRNDKAN